MFFALRRSTLFSVLVWMVLSLMPTPALAVDEFIEINPFLKKIPLAIPDFKPLAEGGATRETSAEA
ncbi:MAG: hypothetical protein PVJ53_13715, partial [Desulfobacterales bacterium]